MTILLLGSGGREHAFAWKIAQSPRCSALYMAPGNAGTAACGENVPVKATDFSAIRRFVLEKQVDMVVVGPEDPLVNGIHDYFLEDTRLKDIPVIGPVKAGARLEGSKDFAKGFMRRHGIPTAGYASFTAGQLEEAMAYLDRQPLPIVLKADGLAAGKGVLICETREQARQELEEMLVRSKFGEASRKVVIEEFLQGIELSVFVLTDGNTYKILPAAKDYKRIGEGDTGLNTGGMGSLSPVPFADEAFLQKVEERVVVPTIEGLQKEQIPYKGFIFLGLMNVQGDPYVIEYNVRMGDPETQSVLPRIRTDLVELLEAVASGTLEQVKLETDPRTAASVVLVSGGYPGSYEKDKVITGLPAGREPSTSGSIVFHAGTRQDGEECLTAGGRVLAVTSLHEDPSKALDLSRSLAGKIRFEGKYFRQDIGFDVI